MIKLATTKLTGAQNVPPGSRYGRGRSGSDFLSAPYASGAAAYIRALADDTKPTSVCQPGKGRKTTSPTRNAKMRLNHGTRLRCVFRSKIVGRYPLRLMP